MFQDFWDKNKSVVECVGIICGVGALFLAIPSSTNEAAQKALDSLKFLWLFFIALATTFLLLKVLSFATAREEENFKKTGFKSEIGSPSYVITFIISMFLVNICTYVVIVYQEPLKFFGGIVISSLIYYLTSLFIRASTRWQRERNGMAFRFAIDLAVSALCVAGWLPISVLTLGTHITMKLLAIVSIVVVVVVALISFIRLWSAKNPKNVEPSVTVPSSGKIGDAL